MTQSQDARSPSWQESLNPQLTQRLLRPLVQPGVISSQLSQSILMRAEQMAHRLPLMPQLLQRQHQARGKEIEGAVPIVYAQPMSRDESELSRKPIAAIAPPLSSNPAPLVQAKFMNSHDRVVPVSDANRIFRGTDRPPVSTAASQPERLRPVTRARALAKPSFSSVVNRVVPQSTGAPTAISSQTLAPHPASPVIQRQQEPTLFPPDATQRFPLIQRSLEQSTVTVQLPQATPLNAPLIQPFRDRSVTQETQSTQAPTQPMPQRTLLIQRSVEQPAVKNRTLAPPPLIPLVKPTSPMQQPAEHPVDRPFSSAPSTPTTAPRQRQAKPPTVQALSSKKSSRSQPPLVFTAPSLSLPQAPAATAMPNGRSGPSPLPAPTMSSNLVIQRTLASGSEMTSGAVVPLSRVQSAPVIQRAPDDSTTMGKSAAKIDLDDLAERVQHKLMRQLAVENERRGLTRWT